MASKSNDESKMLVRMSDFTSEPKRMLPPIKGYEKQPLVSLEDAIKPLLSLVPDVEEMAWTVKQNCQNPRDNLSSDESASIMLYTLEWMPREQSFYFILNKTLRSQNRGDLLPWFLYIRLFMFALSKLPPTTHRMIYRGIKMDVSEDFPEGKIFIWWAFSSCSSSIKVLQQFLGTSGHRTIFNIECDSAKNICQHSFHESENEILMYPARQFQVVASLNTGNQLQIIHVKEIQPPFPLIHIPPTSSSDSGQMKEVESSLSVMRISLPSSTKSTYENKQLQQIIDQCEPQSRINLDNQSLTDEDMEIVVREAIINKQCKKLELSHNKITSVGVSIIAEVLDKNTTLEVLYLTDNHLSNNSVCTIAKTLSLNSCIVDTLCLQSTGVTDEGVGYIAEMLKTNTKLQRLLLGGNEITDIGVQRLANVLIHHNSTLVSLRINRSKEVSDSSIDILVKMLKQNQTLERLDIEKCNLSETGEDRLRQIAQSKKGFKLEV